MGPKSRRIIFLLMVLWVILFETSAWSMGKARPAPVIAAIGDSITAVTPLEVESMSTVSWFSGTDVRSHLVRMRARFGSDVQALNLAQLGATAEDATVQARKFVSQVREGLENGEYSEVLYVTVFIGSDDACVRGVGDGSPDDKMKEALDEMFLVLSELGSEKLKVLVVAPPKKEFSKTHDILERKKKVIEVAVADARARHASLEIFYSDVLSQGAIESELLALDCFHPSVAGHERISTLLWDAQPWFE